MLLGGELVLDEVLQGSGLGGSLLEASLEFLYKRGKRAPISTGEGQDMGDAKGHTVTLPLMSLLTGEKAAALR